MAKRNALADGSTERAESAPDARRAWFAAREKARCTKGDFQVTGADIARIARTMLLDPRHFTQTAPAQADDPVGINVHQGRRRVTLGLATSTNGCVFLIRTTGGPCLCGLGSLAPLSCQLFTEADDSAGADDTLKPMTPLIPMTLPRPMMPAKGQGRTKRKRPLFPARHRRDPRTPGTTWTTKPPPSYFIGRRP